MLGTDYPFPLGEVTGFNNATPGKVIEECSHFDQKLRQKLLFDNGMNFLGLNPQDYMWTFEWDWGFVSLFENILFGIKNMPWFQNKFMKNYIPWPATIRTKNEIMMLVDFIAVK